MADETLIRKLLIDSCHSSADAESQLESRLDDSQLTACLVRIARDADDYGGDAPMQAAYYLSKTSADLLAPHESALIDTIPVADDAGYTGHIAIALAKTNTVSVKPLIERAAAEGRIKRGHTTS